MNQPLSDKEVKILTKAFKRAVREIQKILKTIDPTDPSLSKAFLEMRLAEIYKIMKDLGGEASAWVDEFIPQFANNGAAAVLVDLGIVKTLDEARTLTKLSTMREDLTKRRILIVKDDILRGIDASYQHIRKSIQKVSAKVMLEQYGTGMVNKKTVRDELVKELRKELDSIKEPYVSTGKKRWRIDDYGDMLARTHQMNTHHEHTVARAEELECNLAVISTYRGTTDACLYHQGRIVSLVKGHPKYPYWMDLKEQIFHPRCRHRLMVISDESDLELDEYETAKKQQVVGDRALNVLSKNGKMVTKMELLEKKMDGRVPAFKDDRTPKAPAKERLREMLIRNGIDPDKV
ncbi:MAG: phage minor capsid protein [Bacillota bacterium]